MSNNNIKSGSNFWKMKKKNNWFCNRPLSPVLNKNHETINEPNEDHYQPPSPMYDSDADPEYFPDSDISQSDESNPEPLSVYDCLSVCNGSEYILNLNQGTKKENDKEDISNLAKKFQILQNIVLKTGNSSNTTLMNKEIELFQETQSLDSSGEDKLTSVPEIDVGKKKKIYKRKSDMCYFCETDVQNFVRHLRRNHFYELEVQEIFIKGKRTKERRDLLALLKKKGNFLKNSKECVRPVKQALLPDQSYLPCTNCLGFYRSKFLYRHRKKCVASTSSKNAQSEAQNFLVKGVKRIDLHLKSEVFPRMRADKISLEAKNDFLICAFGARYLKIHREKHFINVTSRKMRELSRILLEFKKLEPTVNNLFEALKPKFYNQLVEATKSVAKYDSKKDLYLSPTYAINICSSLKQCCDIAIHMVIKTEPSVETASCEASLKTMINLLQSNWRFDISSRALNDLNINKFNKITIVPLASDLKLLKDFLITKAEDSLKLLKENSKNITAYKTLLETIYCRLILLNRRRPGELQRMTLHTYQEAEKKNATYEEFKEVISETERILLKNLKRIVIRGKRGRGVPVLFSVDIQNHIKELLKVRSNFLTDDNLYLFGKPGVTTPLCGYKIVEKYAIACGAKNPKGITCTRLRKHLATLTQLFNLNENEIEQLSSFMGHTPGVHKNSYRLPDDIYHTAKISKILILLEKGEAGEHKGKSLDDISVDLEENLLQSQDSSDEDDENEDSNDDEDEENMKKIVSYNKLKDIQITEEKIKVTGIQNQAQKKDEKKEVTRVQKRVLVPWTDEQKEAVKSFFANNIKQRRPPKRKECESLKELYPELLKNKDWLKIKVYIQNVYSKKSK